MELNNKFVDERDFVLKNQQNCFEQLQQKQQEFQKVNEENKELREKILKQQNELIGEYRFNYLFQSFIGNSCCP